MAIQQHDANLLLVLLILATGLLLAGLVMPMLTMTRLVFFSDSFSVVSGVYELLQSGHVLLFIIVTGFSIVLPVIKLVILFRLVLSRAAHSRTIDRLLHLMHEYGRWAMLDVMVVAILIVTVKLGAIVSIEIHAGLYVFGMAVLIIMWTTNRLVRLTSDDI